MVCITSKKGYGNLFSLQPSQIHVPWPPTRCHLQCCPFSTACPHPPLWDCDMEPQVLPCLWFVWSWRWCLRWAACHFSLHAPSCGLSSQEICVLILRDKSAGRTCLFAPEKTTNSIFSYLGSCPESLVARGQARLFGVAGSNPPGSKYFAVRQLRLSFHIPCLRCYHPCVAFLFFSFLFIPYMNAISQILGL
jgi:hypothetical protein